MVLFPTDTAQQDLFRETGVPGFRYCPHFLAEPEAHALVEWASALPLKPFEFGAFTGNRRVASFGFRYDYQRNALQPAEGLPDRLHGLRARAADWSGLAADDFQQMLVTEYSPGAPIGWHRDRPHFGSIVGISLGSEARLRLRRREGSGWRRHSMVIEPRSIYLLSGEVREHWEHSIPPALALRYSITMRTLRGGIDRTSQRQAEGL